jgi:AraC-like DNA-binding protein
MTVKDNSEIISMEDYFLRNLTKIVVHNMDNPDFCVENLAKEIGISRSHLYRKLMALTGLSVSQFIREKRLVFAHDLLKRNAGTVSEIAYKTGFSSPNYFSKCFKEKFQLSPGSVRKMKRKPASVVLYDYRS